MFYPSTQKLLFSGYSLRRNFLPNCIAEKVIPKKTYKVIKTTTDIFPKYIHDYLLTCTKGLKHHEKLTNDKATSIDEMLCSKNMLSNFRAESLRQMISYIINEQINHLKHSFTTFALTVDGERSVIQVLFTSSLVLNFLSLRWRL